MIRSRIFWKLFGGFALIILLTGATVYTIASSRVRSDGLAQVEQRLELLAYRLTESLGDDVFGADPTALRRQVRTMGRVANARFTIIGADGDVLADSEKEADSMENHGLRQEVVESRKRRGPASSSRFSRTLREDMMYLSLPVPAEGEIRVFVRAALPTTEIERRLAQLRTNIFIGSTIAVIVAVIVGLVHTRAFVRPIKGMTEVASAVASGDYDRPLPKTSHDELGLLSAALNRMTRQLKERMDLLTRERNQLGAILASMREGVVAVDREERIVHLNAVAAKILGAPRERCVGQRVWEVTRVQAVSDSLTGVLDKGEERTFEARLSASHRERMVQIHASPLRDGDGKTVGAVIVLHDVTELRRLELVRREFVANVSHELKTPLTAIRGFVETLIDDPNVEGSTRSRFLGRVQDQSLRLSALVNDLLTLSRVESEGEALEKTPLDLRDPLQASFGRFVPEGLEMSIEVPDGAVTVLGDEEALRQVVDNLLDNAQKYTSPGGSVKLTLATDERAATIEVSDTGIGIDPMHLDRIFERFYRVDKARSRELGGTGLGLAIVKHIVEAHRGQVSVRSEPGKGTAFRITLPLKAS